MKILVAAKYDKYGNLIDETYAELPKDEVIEFMAKNLIGAHPIIACGDRKDNQVN